MQLEIYNVLGYNETCDWWSVGVILYEMIVGIAPFHDDEPSQTQRKVCTRKTFTIHRLFMCQYFIKLDKSDFMSLYK